MPPPLIAPRCCALSHLSTGNHLRPAVRTLRADSRYEIEARLIRPYVALRPNRLGSDQTDHPPAQPAPLFSTFLGVCDLLRMMCPGLALHRTCFSPLRVPPCLPLCTHSPSSYSHQRGLKFFSTSLAARLPVCIALLSVQRRHGREGSLLSGLPLHVCTCSCARYDGPLPQSTTSRLMGR